MSEYQKLRAKVFQEDGAGYPARTFSELELKPSYETAKKYRIEPLLACNEAQLAMLVKQHIVTKEDAKKIFQVMESMDYDKYRHMEYDGKFEDMFFQIEDEMINQTNGLAGNVHIARSRNDLSVALDHLGLRPIVLQIIKEMLTLMDTVRLFADEYKDAIFPAHTHTQQAQPSVFGHYFLAFYDVLDRDVGRFIQAYQKINTSPLGAAAITTSGFDFDREYIARLLGFTSVIENSFDAIGGCDSDTETATATMLAAVDIGRVITDMVLWATEEMNILRLSDGYISTSSIMPQKRNPIALEHLRSSLSMVKGLCATVIDGYFKAPYGDISDKDDIEPVLLHTLELFTKDIRLLNAVIATSDVNVELLRKQAEESFCVVTEMADTIVRITGIPFRNAHHVVATLVKEVSAKGGNLTSIDEKTFKRVFQEVLGHEFTQDYTAIANSLDPHHFVAIRNVPGGVGPIAMKNMLQSAKIKLEKRCNWYDNTVESIKVSDQERKQAVSAIMNS